MLGVQIGSNEAVEFEFVKNAEEFCGENFLDSGELTGEIKIVGEVVKDIEFFKVCGKIFCKKKFICDRCLNAAEENQIHDFEEEIESAEITENILDITDIVRETLIISQPIRNLCKADCKGLCPICGFNLNEGDCKCDRFTADPRLAILQEMKFD